MKRWFLPAAARARGQSNDLNREILASNLFNCWKEVINAPPVPSISRYIHIVYRHKNIWEYQWSTFIYNCMSTFLHYVHCKDALLDCSAPGGERCESLTRVDEIHQWLRNDAQSLKWHRRGALLFVKVIHQISRSQGSKKRRFWPKLGVSGLYLQFVNTDGYEIMHKAWSSIEEVPYCFSRSCVKFQGHTALKIVKFHPNWVFPDCSSSLNSPMATKWCTKLEVE